MEMATTVNRLWRFLELVLAIVVAEALWFAVRWFILLDALVP